MTVSPQQRGRDFEVEMANSLGLSLVPGSGAVWYSKLDLKGNTARWSLKYTAKESFPLSQEFIDEAVFATQSLTGDGRTPVWLVRLQNADYDLVILRKDDFMAMQAGEIQILEDKKPKQSDIRKAKSKIPALLRED